MKSKKMLLNIALKLIPSLFAYFSIGLQSHSLSQTEFNTLSIIGNAIVLSTFLDLGVGVQFIQSYFSKFSDKDILHENRNAFGFLGSHFRLFTSVSLIQAFLVSLYTFFSIVKDDEISKGTIISVTFAVTFVFSITGLLSRVLTARGLILELLLFQFIGIFIQTITTLLAFALKLNLTYFLMTLAIPNMFVGFLTFTTIKMKSHLGFQTASGDLSEELSPLKQFSFISNSMLQILQLIQFASITIPLAVFVRRADPINGLSILIQWRIFSSVAAALSSFNFLEWRINGLMRAPVSEFSISDRSYLIRKITFGLALSGVSALATSRAWGLLSNDTGAPSVSIWVIWSAYVAAQVVQWHFYYKILPMGRYGKLLIAIVIQMSLTILVITLLGTEWQGFYPMSLFVGILISALYLWHVSIKLEPEVN